MNQFPFLQESSEKPLIWTDNSSSTTATIILCKYTNLNSTILSKSIFNTQNHQHSASNVSDTYLATHLQVQQQLSNDTYS